MTPQQLVAMAQDMCRKSGHDLQAAIDRVQRSLTPEERLALKIEVARQSLTQTQPRGPGARMVIKAYGGLATDDAEYHGHTGQPMTEIERMMQRAGLQPNRKYSPGEVDERCHQAGITDPTQKLAIKLEAEQRGMLAGGGPSGKAVRKLIDKAFQENPKATEHKRQLQKIIDEMPDDDEDEEDDEDDHEDAPSRQSHRQIDAAADTRPGARVRVNGEGHLCDNRGQAITLRSHPW